MSYTDLAQLAQQQRPQPQPPPQPPTWAQTLQGQYQQNPEQLPPDPRSFTQSATNPIAAVQAGGLEGGTPAGLESDQDLGDVEKTKAKEDDQTKEPAAPEAPAEPEEPATHDPTEGHRTSELFPSVSMAPAQYQAPAANRGPSEWGQEWGPIKMAGLYDQAIGTRELPPVALSYGEVANGAQALAQYSAPSVAEPMSQAALLMSPIAALLDGISQGKFSHNFSQTALRGLEIRRLEGVLRAEQGLAAHREILTTLGPILYAEQSGAISYREAMRRVGDYLNQIQHGPLMAEFARNGLRGVADWLAWEDAYNRKVLGGVTQIRKGTDLDSDRRELDSLGLKGGGQSGGLFGFDTGRLPGRGGGPPAPVTPPTPDQPTAEPTAPLSLSDADRKIGDSLHYPNGEKIPLNETKTLLEEAKKATIGDPTAYAYKPRGVAAGLISQAALGYQRELQQAIGKTYPGRTPHEQQDNKAAALDKIVPGYGRKIWSLGNYHTDPKAVPEKDRERTTRLVQSVYPDYDTGTYDKVQRFGDTRSTENKTMVRATDAANAATVALDRLNAVVRKFGADTPIIDKFKQWEAGIFKGDKEYADLFQAIFVLSSATQGVYSMSGTGRVTLIKEMMRHLQPNASAAQIAAQIRTEISGVYSIVNNYLGQWQGDTGRQTILPGIDTETFETLRGLVRINPDTGQVPGDKNLPSALKAVGREGPAESAPLTMREIDKLQKFIEREKRNPDPEMQHQVLRAQQAIGPILGIGRVIEGDDIAD